MPRAASTAPRTAPHDPASTRQRLFAAACTEFAARGFAGTSVDRIAAQARVNKAMIYYHFTNKAELYREILRDMFQSVASRAREVAASSADPSEKIRRFVAAIAVEAEARPHFPPVWFREIADGGRHLDPPTLAHIAGVVQVLATIVEEGVAAGRFKPVSPVLLHSGIVAPLLLFFASGGLRIRLARGGVTGAAGFGTEEVVTHVQQLALAMVERQQA
jgi:AcrR family transcriptional regulator